MRASSARLKASAGARPGGMVEVDHAGQRQEMDQCPLAEFLPVVVQRGKVGKIHRACSGGIQDVDHPGQRQEMEKCLLADQGLEAAQLGPAVEVLRPSPVDIAELDPAGQRRGIAMRPLAALRERNRDVRRPAPAPLGPAALGHDLDQPHFLQALQPLPGVRHSRSLAHQALIVSDGAAGADGHQGQQLDELVAAATGPETAGQNSLQFPPPQPPGAERGPQFA